MTLEESDLCLALVHGTFREVMKGPEVVLARHGLGRAHHRALFTVRKTPGIQVGDLARMLQVTTQALHKTLKPLLQHGLIQATRAPLDARARTLRLTQVGEGLEAEVSGMYRDVFRRVERLVGRTGFDLWMKTMQILQSEAAAVNACCAPGMQRQGTRTRE